jgi:hypothetical protein
MVVALRVVQANRQAAQAANIEAVVEVARKYARSLIII